LVAVDKGLRPLEEVDQKRAQIVELRFFGGPSAERISKVMELSTATINRQRAGARVWLRHELKPKE
jgi:DNA-directed RNA polymerase specialized sigma24 family protein